MTFNEFKSAYLAAFSNAMSVSLAKIDNAGFEQMADLEEMHPEWAEIVENEL